MLVLLQSLLTPPYWEFLSTNTEILHSDGQSWGILREVELGVDENYEWATQVRIKRQKNRPKSPKMPAHLTLLIAPQNHPYCSP